MVLVNKEWQNKCEDVQTPPSTTTATTAPTTSAAASIVDLSGSIPGTATTDINTKNIEYKPETLAEDFINSVTDSGINTSNIATEETAKIIINKSLSNDNINNDYINEIINDKNSLDIVCKSKLNDDDINDCKISAKQLKEVDILGESNYNNNIKIMAENNKESTLKEEEVDEEPQGQTFIDNNYSESNKDFDETNSNLSLNMNTLTTASITVKTQHNNQQENVIIHQQPQHELQLTCHITPHSLGSALQSALNPTNNVNNSSVAAAGLQPNFLSQLAMTANEAGLQKPTTTTTATIITATQLNQSFNKMDSNNRNNSDSNVSEGSTASVPARIGESNGQAKIVLFCEGNSHPFQARTISLTPNVECMVGRLIAKSKASENNAIFDCKVLSRKHAVIWYSSDGKFWVKDTKSSNGTFINDNKLGDEEAELHFADIVKFGVDVLENSRKEVHGCIIACVKLYLPDGRESISIDSSAHRSQYSGEGRITYDELHRLNLYIQETSQREKVLTSKLFNLQNVLDATRKNSALCWQSMITEDQLLHRIHSLEKKLQFMEKNVPENILRNEVVKLVDDKNSYQHTAKEALRKVYQERCDAMQKLARVESAYTLSENECSVLRDQIMNSKQTLQDFNTRLIRLETEYHEYKDEVERQQQDAKDREELRITELTEKLRERELECEDLEKKISELLIKRAELLDNEELLLEKQAIEKLDAAIADMDLEDDDDSSDDYEDKEHDNDRNENEDVSNKDEEIEECNHEDNTMAQNNETNFAIIRKKSRKRPQLASIFDDKFNGINDEDQNKFKITKAKAVEISPPKRVKETTIMKWLRNSDLNKNEKSFDIFKAICNENENDEDYSDICGNSNDNKSAQAENLLALNETNLLCNFTSKLKNVQKNLKQLEAEIEKKNESCVQDEAQFKVKSEYLSDDDPNDAKDGACSEEDFVIASNGKTFISSQTHVLSRQNKNYVLLKSSVDMLREAYNEICDSVREETQEGRLTSNIKQQLQTLNKSPGIIIEKQNNNKPRLQTSESDNTESDSDIESLTMSTSVNSSHTVKVIDVKAIISNEHKLLEQLEEYQSQVDALNEKLQQTELEAQHTLEIMQVECDDVKSKMQNLNKIIEVLKSDKIDLEKVIKENQSNRATCGTLLSSYQNAAEGCNDNDTELEKEKELEDDVLSAINSTALECEEELIAYKERLEKHQTENINLRNEIALLKLTYNTGTRKSLLLKQYIPYGVIVLAIIIYFLTTYF